MKPTDGNIQIGGHIRDNYDIKDNSSTPSLSSKGLKTRFVETVILTLILTTLAWHHQSEFVEIPFAEYHSRLVSSRNMSNNNIQGQSSGAHDYQSSGSSVGDNNFDGSGVVNRIENFENDEDEGEIKADPNYNTENHNGREHKKNMTTVVGHDKESQNIEEGDERPVDGVLNARVTMDNNEDNDAVADKTSPSSVDADPTLPHVVFDDLRYRRVCAHVYSSELCMIIRYPFEVPLQDPSFEYPRPYAKEFDTLRDSAIVVQGTALEACKRETTAAAATTTGTTSLVTSDVMSEYIKECLDSNAAKDTAVLLWTRRKGDTTSLYDIDSEKQRKRVDSFFHGHTIISLGDSRGDPSARGIMDRVLGQCSIYELGEGKDHHFRSTCQGHSFEGTGEGQEPRRKLRTGSDTLLALDDENVSKYSFAYEPYHPEDITLRRHRLPEMNLIEKLQEMNVAREPGWTELQNMTLMVHYPSAHAQTQTMIRLQSEWPYVKETQVEFPRMLLNGTTDVGRSALEAMGYNLVNVIVFSGMPQFFPTITGGLEASMLRRKAVPEDFVKGGGYAGWKPEYGDACRGPLPPTNKLKEVDQIAERSFEENGMDMRWYGHIWEFSNLLWWMTSGWRVGSTTAILDCTHGEASWTHDTPAVGDRRIFYEIQSFFLQSMIDSHYEDLGVASSF